MDSLPAASRWRRRGRRRAPPRRAPARNAAASAAALLALALLPLGARGNYGCPNDCNFAVTARNPTPAGYCNASGTPTCVCSDAFSPASNDCGDRACPFGPAWWARPAAGVPDPHLALLECSGRGACVRQTGTCACDSSFEGAACERARCGPGGKRGVCGLRGRCVTLREAGRLRAWDPVAYEGWDADRVSGCLCDEGWGAYDCQQRLCAATGDPLATGGAEAQDVATALVPPRGAPYGEVQTLAVDVDAGAVAGGGGSGGGADVDEVQVVVLAGTTDVPWGNLTLALNCSAGAAAAAAFVVLPGACGLFPDARRVAGVTSAVAIAYGAAAADIAADVRAALEALPAIAAPGALTVTAAVNATAIVITVAFSGAAVPGDVAPLTVVSGAGATSLLVASGALLAPAAYTLVHGSEVAGALRLTWDDAASFPGYLDLVGNAACADTADGATALVSAGVQSVSVSPTATEAAFAAAVAALVFPNGTEAPPAGAIVASKSTAAGGPGVSWAVTFAAGARARGNVAPLVVSAAGTALYTSSPSLALTGNTTPAALVTETLPGAFINGSWAGVLLPYARPLAVYGRGQGYGLTPLIGGPFPWCVSGAVLAAAINAAESPYGVGAVSVVRSRALTAPPGGAGSPTWLGAYTWRVYFRGSTDDLPLLTPVVGDAPLGLVDVADGSPAGVSLGVSEFAPGGPTAAVAEVQLIDCACPACSDPLAHYIRLAFGPHVTGRISYNASAADVRAALVALPGVPDVLVSQADAARAPAFALCSPAGVTTAVTFTHAAGRQPPLHPAGPPVVDGNALPPGNASSSLTLRVARGWGLSGARARAGTRALVECSGRGECDAATGTCACYAGWAASDGGLPPEAPNAPAAAAARPRASRGDCAFASVAGGLGAVAACPSSNGTAGAGACSGRGACSGPPDWVCACAAGYAGAACDVPSTCASGATSWFSPPAPPPASVDDGFSDAAHESGADAAYTAASAHAPALCSGFGRCDPAVGYCACFPGWGGAACSLAPCPGEYARAACFAGAPCVSMADVNAAYPVDAAGGYVLPAGTLTDAPAATGWEAGILRGCVCEALAANFTGPAAFNFARPAGYACAGLACPGGPDPSDPRAFDDSAATWEVQRLTCTLNATAEPLGRLYFSFRGGTGSLSIRTDGFVFDRDKPAIASLQDKFTLESALALVPGLRPFELAPDPPRARAPQVCDATGATSVVITLAGHPGPQPLIDVILNTAAAFQAGAPGGGNVTVTRERRGSGAYVPCNNRGRCDREAGRCACQDGFSSSDGAGGPGQTGDCGYRENAVAPPGS